MHCLYYRNLEHHQYLTIHLKSSRKPSLSHINNIIRQEESDEDKSTGASGEITNDSVCFRLSAN